MNRLHLSVLLLLPLVAGPVAADPTVILLSFDGVRHDYPDRGQLPALERMAREGARAETLVPIFPSSTFPNHVALATGAHADRHGIVGNRFFDPERGEFDYSNDADFLEAEPLWATAERQGVRAAAFFWVGSETDWRGVGATHRKSPFDSGIHESAKVKQILEWLDLPGPDRPRLIMSWWHGADTAGHRFGPDSARSITQLRAQDAQLVELLAGLDARDAWAETTLLLVSDHGMVGVEEGIDLSRTLEAEGIGARVVSGGGYALVYLDDPDRASEAAGKLAAIDGVRAWRSGEVPEPLRFRHPTRTGHVVAVTDPPRMLTRSSSRLNRWRFVSQIVGNRIGTHGYDPATVPEMGGVLLALGRGAEPGARLGRVRAIDVAPTVTRLLGIGAPQHAEGEPIAALAPAAADGP